MALDGEIQELLKKLAQQQQAVVDEVHRRKQRLEQISAEIARLEHDLLSAESNQRFLCSEAVVIAAANAFVRGIKRKLLLMKGEQQQALDDLGRAVERRKLLEEELDQLEEDQKRITLEDQQQDGAK